MHLYKCHWLVSEEGVMETSDPLGQSSSKEEEVVADLNHRDEGEAGEETNLCHRIAFKSRLNLKRKTRILLSLKNLKNAVMKFNIKVSS